MEQTTSVSFYSCGSCGMCYYDYRQLLEHLFWKHGTESQFCRECGLKQWYYAPHVCNILPIFITLPDDDAVEYCCGRDVDSPMIGCDGPACKKQWFHFPCVGVATIPKGDWLCPDCRE